MGTRQFYFIILTIQLVIKLVSCEYTNEFAIHVEPDVDVEKLASKHGLVNKGQVGSLVGYYILEHPRLHRRSTEYAHDHHFNLRSHPGVLWVEQQKILERSKRDIETDSAPYTSGMFPDPLFSKQWYINEGARDKSDMNTKDAWAMGYTGKNVVVTILDDGIQKDHPDLELNYDRLASYDINDNDEDPTPQDNNDNKHGTRCAGEVAAQAYNEFCGVGIAYNASIGGVRMLDGTVTDHVEAKALSLRPDHIDIYSASWGPEDDGKTIDGPGKLAKKAFIDGIKSGRKGRGSIFVWASGNGGRKQDNCNCDGYTNSIYTLSISSATQSGFKPWYLEECSSTLATTYSSGSPGHDQNIVTVDMDTRYRKSLASGEPVTQYLCTQSHTGTSASAPIAAGIVALALEANPFLTWRDMQHLVVLTSRHEVLRSESGWQTNGVGRRFSHKFGYGLMDAAAMTRLARTWRNVARQRLCESETLSRGRDSILMIPPDGTPLVTQITSNACKNSISEIRYLEHVQAVISLKFRPRGQLRITLTSPSGTSSNLLLPRSRDSEDESIQNWPFLSVHFWGESPEGVWKLSVQNDQPRRNQPGILEAWSLVFYGTLEKPPTYARNITTSFHHLPRRTYPVPREENEIISDCKKIGQFSLSNSQSCLTTCPQGYFADTATGFCQRCSASCLTCFGPSSENCLSCNNGTFYSNDRCVPSCPKGYFADTRLGECLPCSSNCETCSESPKLCTSCSNHLTLNVNSRNCTLPCQSTPAGCKSHCHYLCSSCSGPGESECLTCPPNHRLIEGRCLESDDCPLGYFEQSLTATSISCVKCHSSCKSCNATSHHDCLECADTFKRTDGGLCSHCAPGQYLDSSSDRKTTSCAPCHDSCLECEGPNESNCIRCLDPQLFLLQGRCVPCCTSAHPQDQSKDQAHDCCNCHNGKGPCVAQQFARSVNSQYLQLRGPFPTKNDSWSNSVIFASVLAFSAFVALIFIAFKSFIARDNGSSIMSLSLGKSRPDLKYERLNLTIDDLEEESLFQRT